MGFDEAAAADGGVPRFGNTEGSEQILGRETREDLEELAPEGGLTMTCLIWC